MLVIDIIISSTAGITNSGRDLSNFARIYNCTFQGNSAEEFGGAISMASLLFVTSTQGARPLEIVDRYMCF